jgi:hypothetical protein
LGKDFSFPWEKDEPPAFGDGCEECMGIETAPLFGRYKTYSTTFCLDYRDDGGLADDLASS